MIAIDNNIFGAALSFAGGVGIAAICYAISKYMLKKQSGLYSSMQIVRQLIQIAYLVVIYFAAPRTPWDLVWLLVGGCLGITLPMFFFTYRLVKLNDKMKEDDKNG